MSKVPDDELYCDDYFIWMSEYETENMARFENLDPDIESAEEYFSSRIDEGVPEEFSSPLLQSEFDEVFQTSKFCY